MSTHHDEAPAGAAGAVQQQAVLDQGPQPSGPVALVHATVIDATGAPPLPDRTIVVDGDRIAALGPSDEVAVPADARVLDATGMHVLPGLWDMHVHVFDDEHLPLFLINGVTGMRHMGAAPVHHRWREQLVANQLLAPRTVLASRIIDGPNPLRPNSIAVGDEQEAREAVRQSQRDGADFLKVYNLVPRQAYFALADEARTRGIPFVGHVPLGVTVAEAAEAGQASLEHLEGVLPATSGQADELHRRLAALDVRGFDDMWEQHGLIQQAVDTHDPARARELYARFAALGTWHVPTLAVLQAGAYAGSDAFPLAEYLPYIPAQLRKLWEMAQNWRKTAEDRAKAARLFDHQLRIAGELHEAGVPLMAGTDTFVPGFSLHDELALLVRAGLTEMAALQSATRQPARYLGLSDAFGTVAEGKAADLILLGADPLEDIGNTRDVRAVLLGGKLFDAAELDRMRASTEERIAEQERRGE